MDEIGPEFFQRDPVICARELIGCIFHWDGCAGRIVETEAYAAEGDEACHTFFRPSARNFIEKHAAGDAYVYLNYGVHWLFNVVVKSETDSGFVLLRALEPVFGLEKMRQRRGRISNDALCSGPGNLTKAFGIDGAAHGADFLHSENRKILSGFPKSLIYGYRIGISKSVNLPWRFGDENSQSVSRKFA